MMVPLNVSRWSSVRCTTAHARAGARRIECPYTQPEFMPDEGWLFDRDGGTRISRDRS